MVISNFNSIIVGVQKCWTVKRHEMKPAIPNRIIQDIFFSHTFVYKENTSDFPIVGFIFTQKQSDCPWFSIKMKFKYFKDSSFSIFFNKFWRKNLFIPFLFCLCQQFRLDS